MVLALLVTKLIACRTSVVWKSARDKAVALSLLGTFAAPACADDSTDGWGKFQNGGQCTSSSPLPTQWGADPQAVAWQADLTGYGQSTPVVFDEKIFLTSTSGAMKEKFHVFAVGLGDGKPLWQVNFDNPTPEENNSYVSRAAPSPTVDADAVYALNEGGVLVSLDHAGQVRWQRNLVAEYGNIKARHGLASSLEQDAQHLYVWIERGEEPYRMSVDKATGANIWKVAGLGATTWGSPRLISVDDQLQLVCSASGKLVGFSPATGERLWELTDIVNNTSSTPIPAGNGRFFIGASDGRGETSSSNSTKAGGLVQITSQAGAQTAQFL